jgi:dynein heavy chain
LAKCLHLYETIIVRHGVMIIGPAGGGKSSVVKTLGNALTLLAAEKIPGPKFADVSNTP